MTSPHNPIHSGPSLSRATLVKRRLWLSITTAAAVSVLYAIGYFVVRYAPLPSNGPWYKSAALANRTIYFPVHYLYHLFHRPDGLPFQGAVIAQFRTHHAQLGYLRYLRNGKQSYLDWDSPIIPFVASSLQEGAPPPQPVYHQAGYDYDAWYKQAVRDKPNPDPYVDPIPNFFEAVFLVTYSHQLRFDDWPRGHGVAEIQFIAIERLDGERVADRYR